MHRLILIGAVLCIISLPFMIPYLNKKKEIHKDFLFEIPTSIAGVEQLKDIAEAELMTSLQVFKARNPEELNFNNTALFWNQLIEEFFAACTKLTFLFLMVDDEEISNYAQKIAHGMHGKLIEACQDEEALSLCLNFIENNLQIPDQLSSSERGILLTLLKSVIDGWNEENNLRKKTIYLQQELSARESVLFTYKTGSYPEKQLPQNGKITIVNWNVCFFNYGVSLIFGGVLPWQNRIQKIANKIRSCDADILCLQEMFSFEAAEELYKLLRNDYTHFYLNIGPKLYGFDTETLGLPSGLFVASRYPLNNVSFIPFKQEMTQQRRGYGVFIGDLCSDGEVLARIATTHLQPGAGFENERYRSRQIEAIISHLRATDLGESPCFLCGDLNLEKKSEEYKKLCQNFVDFRKGWEWTCCELRNYWYKARQNPIHFQSIGLEVEWIDYFLQLRSPNTSKVLGTTRVISVNDPRNPEAALSDHQILKTELLFPRDKK